MKLADIAAKPLTLTIEHPELGDVGITAQIRNPSGREYHARYTDALASDEAKTIAVGALVAEAAVISIDGIDDFEYEEGSDIFRQDEFFWMVVQIFDFITKKKAPKKSS